MSRASIPVLLYALLVIAFPVVIRLVARFARPSSALGAKLHLQEPGISPEDGSRREYSVRFFILAMLFVILGVELMFWIPCAILYREWFAAHMVIFALIWIIIPLSILLVGYTWLRRQGALQRG